jgi:D-alanyl-D-alanine carboxypeptidase
MISFLNLSTLPAYASPENLEINSTAALLIDANTGSVIYEKNGYNTYYPASITKLMTALLTIENLSPLQTITFTNDAVLGLPRNSSNIGMKAGEEITVDQALHGLLLMSANEVANGLAIEIGGSIESFAEMMNVRANELGALSTHFSNPHGLHDETHITTAYDMALIAMEISKKPYFQEIMSHITYQIPETNETDEIRYLSQQHRLMNQVRDASAYREDVVGGKTGYTSAAGNTLVTIAEKNGMKLISVILGSDGNNVYLDTNTLLDYGFDNHETLIIEQNDFLETVTVFSTIDEHLEEIGSAEITMDSFPTLIVQSGINQNQLTTSLDLPEFLNESIREGDHVGVLSYYYNNRLLGHTELVVERIILAEKLDTDFKKPFSLGSIFSLVLIIILSFFLRQRRRSKRKRFNYYRRRHYRRRYY